MIERVGRSVLKDEKLPDDLLILSCEEDYDICVPFLEKGWPILIKQTFADKYISGFHFIIYFINRCGYLQFRASTKWNSYSETGVRKVGYFALRLVGMHVF